MTTEPAFCPCCGHNLRAEQPLAMGALRVDPRGDASWDGKPLRLTVNELIAFGSIAAARGRFVSRDVLEERIGYEGMGKGLDVLLVKIRRKLRAAEAPALILNLRGRGWRLDLEQLAANDAGPDRETSPCR